MTQLMGPLIVFWAFGCLLTFHELRAGRQRGRNLMPASKSSAVCRAVLTCSLSIRRASRILRSTDNCAIMNAGRMRSGIGGATAAEPSVELSISPADAIKCTTCYMCACRCGIKVYLKDGKVRYIEGNRDHPVNKGILCGKGSADKMLTR